MGGEIYEKLVPGELRNRQSTTTTNNNNQQQLDKLVTGKLEEKGSKAREMERTKRF
jgi:hypothetical protein